MKILLLEVNLTIAELCGGKKSFAGALNIIPPLGLAYLGAVAEQAGHTVKIIDSVQELSIPETVAASLAWQPEVIGLSSTTPAYGKLLHLVQALRQVLPRSIYLVGGAHPTAAPVMTLATGLFDYLIIGEGEGTFSELLSFVDRGADGPIDDISGLGMMRTGKPYFTSVRSPVSDLDSLPLPARHLLSPLAVYHPTPASYRCLPLAHIITSRGCPTRCTFCDRGVFGERYRERSVDSIMAEVEQVVGELGAREIRFFDDCFTINHERLEALCVEFARRYPGLPWTCLTKVNLVNPEVLKMMRTAGCWQVLFGLESGDETVLSSLGKNTTVAQNKQAVAWAVAAGLRVRADFLVGTPLETAVTLQRTLDFAKSLPLDFAHFNKFVPYPGTELYRQLSEQGKEIDIAGMVSQLDHDALAYVPPALGREEYRDWLNCSYRKFYFRFGYLLRRIMGLRTITEVSGQLKGCFSLWSG